MPPEVLRESGDRWRHAVVEQVGFSICKDSDTAIRGDAGDALDRVLGLGLAMIVPSSR